MDHMLISGSEPVSVILNQTKLIQKVKRLPKKEQNKLKPYKKHLKINYYRTQKLHTVVSNHQLLDL